MGGGDIPRGGVRVGGAHEVVGTLPQNITVQMPGHGEVVGERCALATAAAAYRRSLLLYNSLSECEE